jgi:hypothetical protein
LFIDLIAQDSRICRTLKLGIILYTSKVKTDVTTPGSFLQSQARSQASKKHALKAAPLALKGAPAQAKADYKVELSSKLVAPSLPLPSLPLPEAPSLPVESQVEQEVLEDIKKVKDLAPPEIKAGEKKGPAIIFIKGLDVFSSPLKSESGYAGVGRIAESIEGSRIYGWNQKKEIISEVTKVHKDYPVVLVGHSLGGDTAIEVANELDTLENKFRQVDLLVTMDAIGFNNDVIAQNVKKHLNVFGERDMFLNDGPHVARREEKTDVKNILSPLDHTDLDDDKEIQFEVVSLIEKTLSSSGEPKRT